MNSRERIKSIIAGNATDRCGFWLGHPHTDTWPILHKYFGTSTEEELRVLLHDDVRWIYARPSYKHPDGLPIFDTQRTGPELSAGGVFIDCEEVAELDDFEWPNPDYLDFTDVLNQFRAFGDVYRAGGFWTPFFHEVADFFGMENYFIKMYTHPEVVHAVTKRVIGFYMEANKRFFEAADGLVDAYFFGNDFGTQRDLLISPDSFREFIFPYFKQLTELGHSFDRQVILHSCGAIKKVIPDLINMGVDALHPLQAKAEGMSAESLSESFSGQVAFMGGIDTQDLLINGSTEEVKNDVRRVKRLLGPNVIISPSHEALLPNIPPQNIRAMAEAAIE